MDDPTPNWVLDQAIVAELSRFGDGPTPLVEDDVEALK
jgi:hypothetical protein